MKQSTIEARRYYAPQGGLPAQTELHTGRAVFTEAYAVIPRGVFSDIVTSPLPPPGACSSSPRARWR